VRQPESRQMGREVGTAGLLAGLDEHDHPGASRPVRVEDLERRQGGEGRITVVTHATAVQTVAVAYRRERAESLAPLTERRLLVEMTVDEHGARRAPGRRRVRHHERGQSGGLDDPYVQPRHLPVPAPLRDEVGCRPEVAGRLPTTVERRGERRYGSVFDESRNGLLLPQTVDLFGVFVPLAGHASTLTHRHAGPAGARTECERTGCPCERSHLAPWVSRLGVRPTVGIGPRWIRPPWTRSTC
jgi:hypothetical protein